MRNLNAIFALFVALLALGVLVGAVAVAAAELLPEVRYLEAAAAIPLSILLSLFALSRASRARDLHQRTLGRARGAATAGFARTLAVFALLLAATAALALGVFGLLVLTD